MGGLEGPPNPPQRSGRPGEAVASPDARGPPPQRSEAPG